MNKKEFLEELEERLVGISKEDKRDILQDYEEHFKMGKKKKRSEEEIAKSLGEPKEVAREIRRELSSKGDEELKTEAIETWVVVKQFSKHIFNEAKDKAEEIYNKFNSRKISHWFLLVLSVVLFFVFLGFIGNGLFVFIILAFLIFLGIKIIEDRKFSFSKNKSKKNVKKKPKEKRDKSFSKTLLLLLFNILIFVWIWIALLAAIFSLIIAGIAMVISGILLVVLSIFYLAKYSNVLLTDIFFSILFAGVGVGILGVLFTVSFDKAMCLFFRLTKKYIKLNQELMRK